MKTVMITAAAAVLALNTAPLLAAPAAPQPVELLGDVKLDKIVVENGQEKHILTAPDSVVPGNKLVFSTKYRNVSANEVKNFVVTNPLPAGVALAGDGAAALDVSVDGGTTWGKLAALTVADAAGTRRAAQPGDVTHVRWVLAVLQPGAAGTLNYHAIVR